MSNTDSTLHQGAWFEDLEVLYEIQRNRLKGSSLEEIRLWLANKGFKTTQKQVKDELEVLDYLIEVARERSAEEEETASGLRDRVDLVKDARKRKFELRQIRLMVDEQARFENFLETIRETTVVIEMPKISRNFATAYFEKSGATLSKGPERVVGALLSDIHVGMEASGEELGLRLEHTTKRFHDNFETWSSGIWATIIEQHQIGPVIALALWFLGDIVENLQKRPSARLNIDVKATAQQAIVASRAMADFIVRTRLLFPDLPIEADFVSGNHDYVEKPGDSRPYDSWAVIVAYILQVQFQNDPLVKITAHTSMYAPLQYGSSRILLTHGDGIKGSALLPWYGITRRVARWVGLHQTFFDYVLMGHFHNAAQWDNESGSHVIVNGPFFEGSSYGYSQGLVSRALQKVLVLTENEGVIYEKYINVGSRNKTPEKLDARVWKPKTWVASKDKVSHVI
jgi:hypothetical protein